MLLYVPKRINFGSQTFKMRMNLAVLDWVSCMYTVEPPNKGHIGVNVNSLVLSFVERLSSSQRLQIYRESEYLGPRAVTLVERFIVDCPYLGGSLIRYSTVYIQLPLFLSTSLFQNENVKRSHTSERMYIDIRRPNRRTPLRVLVDKTFRFVEDVWSMYMERNMQVTGYVNNYCYVDNVSSIFKL